MSEITVDAYIAKDLATRTETPVEIEPTSATAVEDNLSHVNDPDGPEFVVGDVVDVMPRTWSGINKPGGAGRIKAVAFDEEEDEYTYTVRYILHGGIEKNVSGVYINMMNEVNKQQRGTKGRCTWCRCFIRDCQHNQEIDPFYVEPVKPAEEQLYFCVDPPPAVTNRKRSIESVDGQQAKKQKQQKRKEARRIASEVYEKEFEEKLLAVALRMKLLPDDDVSTTGTLGDDGELSEEDSPYDPAFAVKSHGRVKRVIVDSDEEEGVVLELPVSQWDDDVAPREVGKTDQDAMETTSDQSNNLSTRALPAQLSGMPTGAVVLAACARVPSLTSAASHPSNVVDLSEDTSSPPAASAASQDLESPEAVARRLHRDILHSCLGPAEKSGFINNSENAHNDRNPADVNRQFKTLLHTLSHRREEEKVQLYIIAYDWFEIRLAQAVGLNMKLDALDDRVRNLEQQLSKTDSFGTPQDEEISRIEDKLERLEWRLTVVFEELERAGFDVFQRLRNIKHAEVRRRTITVEKWKADVLNTKVGLLRRFRSIRNAFEDVEGAWSLRANSYHASGSDSEDSSEGYLGPSSRVPAAASRPSAPRVRDAAKEAGTLVRASSTSSGDSGPRHARAPVSHNSNNGMSRTSSGHSLKSSSDSTKAAFSSSSDPTRTRRKTDGDSAFRYDDDGFIDNREFVPRSDGEGDEAVEMDVVEPNRGGREHRSARIDKQAPPRQVLSEQYRGGSGPLSGSRNPFSRVPSKNTSSNVTVPKYSKGVQREVDFIFGISRQARSSESEKSSNEALRRSHSVDGSLTVRENDLPSRGPYGRASGPFVLDLPRRLRYHGRVMVLEGIISGARALPPLATSSFPLSGSTINPRTELRGSNFGGDFGSFDDGPFGYDDYSVPVAQSATHGGGDRDVVPIVSASRVSPSSATGALPHWHDFTDPSGGDLDTRYDDETLVDVVLSSMVNPFAVEPPLHTRRQFYQLSARTGCIDASEVRAVDVWAAEFVEHLVSEATSAAGDSMDVTAVSAEILRVLSPAVVSTVSHLLQSLTNYEEMVARGSQLHVNPVRSAGGSKFNASVEFGSLVSLTGEKVAKLGEVLRRVVKHLFAPTPGRDSAGRAACASSLVSMFDTAERVVYSQHADGSSVPSLGSFLRRASSAGSKSADLSVHIALSILRLKLSLLKNCALHTAELAKQRQPVDTTDVISVMDRMENEAADWDVMNYCFEQLLTVQRDVMSALLGNSRVLFAVLHCLSAIPSVDAPLTTAVHTGEKFERGIGGAAKLVASVVYESLAALRELHVTINTARTALANGARVWACYDASREQANGVIATYQKNIWRSATLAIYAHVAGSRGSTSDCVTGPLLRGSVNPVVYGGSTGSTGTDTEGAGGSDSGGDSAEEDVIWAALVVFTHCLRTVKFADQGTAASGAASRSTSRVEGAWSLLKGLAQVTTQATLRNASARISSVSHISAGDAGMHSVVRLLHRIGYFAALWQDSSNDATALTLSTVNRVSPFLGTLLPVHPPLASGSMTSVVSNGTPALETKSVLFLCYHTFFTAHRDRHSHAGELSARKSLARQLDFIVAMMFETFKLPHAFLLRDRSVLALDSASDLTVVTEQSLRAIDDLRDAFKNMLYNAYTEACGPRDPAAISANLTAIKTAAAKLPRTHQKLHLMSLLNSAQGSDLQCSMLLLGLIAELAGFFGVEAVRLKLKLVPAPGTAAAPLQQQLMDILVGKFAAAGRAAPTPELGQIAESAGQIPGAVTMSEIDQLLQKVPLQQQTDRQSVVTSVNPAVNPAPAASSSIDAPGLQLCLLWHAGLRTLAPFPADAAVCASIELPVTLGEADLKRMVESQRAEMTYLEPFVQLLRHSVQSQQASREWMSLPGVKKMVDASLSASLAASATILRHLGSVTGSRHTIRLDTRAEGSKDVHSHVHQLALLRAPLLTEILSVLHVCLPGTSKDGPQNSAAYVMSQLILYLQDWHAAAGSLLSVAQRALNLDAPARAFLAATIAEEKQKLSQLLSEMLKVRAAGASLPYKSATSANAQSPKLLGSEVVAVFRTLLLTLSGSVKSLEVCGLQFSADFAGPAAAEFAGVTSKFKVHKNNLAPGCCFAICKSLGGLVSLLMDAQYRPNPITSSAAFLQVVVSEVMETLEKVDQAAAMVSANGLLGNWLKIVFWSPVLQTLSQNASAAALSLVHPYFSSLVCAWFGCALAGSSNRTLGTVAQQISLPVFQHALYTLSPVLVQTLRNQCGASGVSKLAAPELQCMRLAEIVTQTSANSIGLDAAATSVRFLRLLAAGSSSSVLSALLKSYWCSGNTSYSFPAVHRAAFETTNVQLSREVLKCLQVLNFTIFRYGDIPARAAEKLVLLTKVASLKGMFCDVAYLYRVLVAPSSPRAPQLSGTNSYAPGSDCGASPALLSAQLLRGAAQLPRMVTLDQADSFLAATLEADVHGAVSGMFKCALKGNLASAEDRIHLKTELKRSFLLNVPKYLLLASDTPYSTRQTAWRVLLAPLLLTPAHTPAGVYYVKQRADKLSGHHTPAPMLTEASMGEDAYFLLLVSALTLALPVPEKLALLVPAMSVLGDYSLRNRFVELVTARLKVPVKQVTIWELYAQLVSVVMNTFDASRGTNGADQEQNAPDLTHRQDAQLTRFKQYVLLSGGSSVTALNSSSTANRLGSNVTSHSCALWEQVGIKAQEMLGARVAEEQQRQSLGKRGPDFQSAAVAMCLLPAASARAALHLHATALEDVVHALVCHVSTSTSSSETAAAQTASALALVPNTSGEKEEVLSLVVCSAFHAVRAALAVAEMRHRVTSEFTFITESSKNHLQALLQYFRLAAEGARFAWSRFSALVQPWQGTASTAVDIHAETEIVRHWGTVVQQLRQVLLLGTNVRSAIWALVWSCWHLLQQLYVAACCNNMLLVDSFIDSAAPIVGTALPPPPQVAFSAGMCACVLCANATSGATVFDGTENPCSVQALQQAVLQLHRALLQSTPASAAELTDEQCATLQNELKDALTGVDEDVLALYKL